MIDKNKIHIYTDGACKGNPGIGGWGALLKYSKSTKELKGYELDELIYNPCYYGINCCDRGSQSDQRGSKN